MVQTKWNMLSSMAPTQDHLAARQGSDLKELTFASTIFGVTKRVRRMGASVFSFSSISHSSGSPAAILLTLMSLPVH